MKKKDQARPSVVGALSEDYAANVQVVERALRVGQSFDMLTKRLVLEDGELTLFFIDGFAKDTVLQKLMK